MDSDSLVKTKDMPAVGALYPRRFESRGYWWWKAQEITYALRPMRETLQAFHSKFENKLGNMIAFQIRRTDKTQGCAEIYGMFCAWCSFGLLLASTMSQLTLSNY